MILTPQSIFVKFTKYIEQYLHDIFATHNKHHTVPYKSELPQTPQEFNECFSEENVENYDCSRTS